MTGKMPSVPSEQQSHKGTGDVKRVFADQALRAVLSRAKGGTRLRGDYAQTRT